MTSDRTPLRAAVVGCRMGRVHAKALAEVEDYRLVALCDLNEGTAREVATDTGSPKVYADYGTMLAEARLDVVAVATPTSSHAELTLRAVEAGVKGVYCEKPMATCLADARKMAEACQQKSVELAVNHQLLVQDEEGGWRPVPLDGDTGSDWRADTIPQSYRAFAHTVRSGAYHPLCAENALRGFEVVMAIYESARSRTKIDFPLTQTRFPLDIMAEAGEV